MHRQSDGSELSGGGVFRDSQLSLLENREENISIFREQQPF